MEQRAIAVFKCCRRAHSRSPINPNAVRRQPLPHARISCGLLHGSQPDCFVVCHEPGRKHVLGHAEFPLPSIEQVIEQTIALGRLTNPGIRCVGVSLNTAKLDEAGALREIESVEKRLALPVADPMRGGQAFERLLDACL